jgi:streptogramin lyase
MIVGPEGAVWCMRTDQIFRITTAGVVTEFPLPPPQPTNWSRHSFRSLAASPDGSIWFAEDGAVPRGSLTWKIGRMTTAGLVTEYDVSEHDIHSITVGPDGALWFTSNEGIGRITTSGVVTGVYPTSSFPSKIITGRDGALWFLGQNLPCPLIDFCSFTIGRIDTTGAMVEYPVQTAFPADPALQLRGEFDSITSAPDGSIWVSKPNGAIAVNNQFAGGTVGQVLPGPPETIRPVSRLERFPAPADDPYIILNWTGTDTGSGIRDFSIYVSDNGSPFFPWMTRTYRSDNVFQGLVGHTYGFYSIARDYAGNEEVKTAADITVHISGPLPPPPGDLNGDGNVNCQDIAIVKASFGKRSGQTGFNSSADVNQDGMVDIRDLAWVSQKLPAGTRCP